MKLSLPKRGKCKKVMVNPKELRPMPEVIRENYDPKAYQGIVEEMKECGYDMAYALKGIYSRKTGVIEIYEGIHRREAAAALGIKEVPVYVWNISRKEAIGDSFRKNRLHAWFNAVDKARQFKAMADLILREKYPGMQTIQPVGQFARGGRGIRGPLHDVAKIMKVSLSTVQDHIRLLELPKDVLDLVGKGKLPYSVALKFLTLKDEDLIRDAAKRAMRENWSRRTAQRKVQQIKAGEYKEFNACQSCGNSFSRDDLNNAHLCSECRKNLSPYFPLVQKAVEIKELCNPNDKFSRNPKVLKRFKEHLFQLAITAENKREEELRKWAAGEK